MEKQSLEKFIQDLFPTEFLTILQKLKENCEIIEINDLSQFTTDDLFEMGDLLKPQAKKIIFYFGKYLKDDQLIEKGDNEQFQQKMIIQKEENPLKIIQTNFDQNSDNSKESSPTINPQDRNSEKSRSSSEKSLKTKNILDNEEEKSTKTQIQEKSQIQPNSIQSSFFDINSNDENQALSFQTSEKQKVLQDKIKLQNKFQCNIINDIPNDTLQTKIKLIHEKIDPILNEMRQESPCEEISIAQNKEQQENISESLIDEKIINQQKIKQQQEFQQKSDFSNTEGKKQQNNKIIEEDENEFYDCLNENIQINFTQNNNFKQIEQEQHSTKYKYISFEENFSKIEIADEIKSFREELKQSIQNKRVLHLKLQLQQIEQKHLNKIIQQIKEYFPEIYTELCQDTDLFIDDEYETQKKKILMFAKIQKWDKCNEYLKKYFNINKNASYSLYKHELQQYQDIQDPIEVENKQIILQQLKQVQVYPDIKEAFLLSIELMEEDDIEGAIGFFEEISNLNIQFLTIISEQICQYHNKINDWYLNLTFKLSIQQLFDSYQVQGNEIILNLQKKNLFEASTQFKLLIYELKFKIFPLYEKICEIVPDFNKFVPKIQIFQQIAPPQLRFVIQELFEILSLYDIKTNTNKIQALNGILKSIFYQDSTYFSQLFEFLKQQYKDIQLELPLSLENLRIQSLQQINNIIPKIEKKYTINDFMMIHTEYDKTIAFQNLIKEFKQENTLNPQILYLIIFEQIKSKCNFQQLVSQLSKFKNGKTITQQTLINFILKNSNRNLRTLLYMSCSTFIPLPLISYDYENSQDKNILIFEELFYTFEKYKSIFSFKLSSNKNQGTKGNSTFVNLLFQKNFEKHQDNNTNFGNIDIQFDYNFSLPMCIPVADAHGYLHTDILQKVYILFDIFIIHTYNNSNDQLLLNQEIEFIQKVIPEAVIICIIHDEEYACQEYNVSFQKPSLYQVNTFPLDKLQHQTLNNLRDEIFCIVQNYIQDFQCYLGNTERRISSMRQYSKFMSNFKLDNSSVLDGIKLVEGFLQQINENIHNLHSEEFLQMNYLYDNICTLSNELLVESEMQQFQREQHRSNIESLKVKLNMIGDNKIVNILCQMIEYKNFIGIQYVTSKILKGLLEHQLKPLLEERQKFRDILQSDELSEEEKQLNMLEIKQVTEKIENKWFSCEFVNRELYFLGKFGFEKLKYKNIYKDLAQLQILQGQPFEVIDGNNLMFISDIYDVLYKDNSDQVLVVSVMGPQSSGKSLLLNFLFGTQFLSSAGRCTKGVYGTILTLQSDKQLKYNKILLLDTEGIQAAEARDDQFDRRIVFYILCVSHVVLICNKGEMNSQMSEIIKLATDTISTLKESIVSAPSVNIVMNMLAQINQSALEECIQKLSNAILEMDKGQNLRKLFQITKENVFLLPYAFDRSGTGQMIVNQPSQQFANELEPLKKKVLAKIFENEQQSTSNYTIQEWFVFAYQFWEFTHTFKGLTDYNTLDQKKQDQKVLGQILILIEENFDQKIKENQEFVNNIVKKVIKPHEGAVVTKIETIQAQIKEEIQEIYGKLSKRIEEEYVRFCGDKNINVDVREKRKGQLIRQMQAHQTEWIAQANLIVQEFADKKSKIIGDTRLQKFINESLNEQSSYSEEEAQQKFQHSWNIIEQDIQKMLKSSDFIRDEVFQLVHQLYKNQIMDKHFENLDQEKSFFDSYIQQRNKTVIHFIEKFQQRFFYYIGNMKKPTIDNVLSFQNQNRQYLNAIPKDLYFKQKTYTIFKWERFLLERFNFLKVQEKLINILQKKNEWGWFNNSNTTQKDKLLQLQNDIDEECRKYHICSLYFTQKLVFIDHTISQYTQLKELESNLLKSVLNEFFLDVLQNLTTFFVYKKNEDYRICSNYYYINKEHIRSNYKVLEQKSKCYFYIGLYQSIIKTQKESLDFEPDLGTDIIFIQDEPFVNCNALKNESVDLENYFFNYFSPLNENGREVQCAYNYFFKNIKWNGIVIEIEKIVLQNYKCDGKLENSESIESWLNQLQLKKSQQVKRKFVRLTSRLISEIATNVNILINKIDEELEHYRLGISEVGVQTMHLIAQTMINALAQELELIGENAALEMLKDSKEAQKQMFIAKLTSNDQATDRALALKSASNIVEFIQSDQKENSINFFKKSIENTKQHFQKINVIKRLEEFAIKASSSIQEQAVEQQHCDSDHSSEEESNEQFQLRAGGFREGRQDYKQPDNYKSIIGPLKQRINKKQKQNHVKIKSNSSLFDDIEKDLDVKLDELIQFYVDPKLLLHTKFFEQWNSIAKNEIHKCKINYKNKVMERINQIQFYFDTLKQSLKEKNVNIDSNSLFINQETYQAAIKSDIDTPQPEIENQAENSKKGSLQKAASLYLIKLINQEWSQEQEIIADGKIIIPFPLKYLPLPSDIEQSLDPKICQIFETILTGEKLSMISTFVKEIIDQLDSLKNETKELEDEEIIGDLLQEFKSQFVGCLEHCPLCRRQCDMQHKGVETKHQCIDGHQIQGFGGNRHYQNNDAVTIGCTELKEGDEVVYKDESMKWTTFKQRFKEWNFEASKQSISLIKEKNIKIWNYIGTQICQYYRDNKKIQINYTPAFKNSFSKTHYILLLDRSGSMVGQRWEELLQSIISFMKKLESNMLSKMYSRISIIGHDHASQKIMYKRIPSIKLVEKIIFNSGDNDFDLPLRQTKHWMEKSYDEFEKFIVCFMSDGGWTYPEDAVKEIQNSQRLMSKLNFTGIGFGESQKIELVLKKMALNLGGKMSSVLDAQELTNAFIKLIPNIYE